MTEEEVLVVHVNDTQDVKILPEKSFLEIFLYFKTTSIGNMVEEDIKDYPHVPAD